MRCLTYCHEKLCLHLVNSRFSWNIRDIVLYIILCFRSCSTRWKTVSHSKKSDILILLLFFFLILLLLDVLLLLWGDDIVVADFWETPRGVLRFVCARNCACNWTVSLTAEKDFYFQNKIQFVFKSKLFAFCHFLNTFFIVKASNL